MGFRNVNSLPTQKSNSKNNQLIQDIRNAQLDCLGVAEVNLAWQNLPFHDQLKERFKGSLEFAHYTTANNQDPSFQGEKQSGGTMIITNGEAAQEFVDPNMISGNWEGVAVSCYGANPD